MTRKDSRRDDLNVGSGSLSALNTGGALFSVTLSRGWRSPKNPVLTRLFGLRQAEQTRENDNAN
jgi:hypothetical protein